MAKLSDEEQKAFDELTKKVNAKDDDDDDDVIEWWTDDGKGARRGGSMTAKRARSTGLFPDLFGEKQEGGKKDDKEKNGGGDKGNQRTSQRYFGNRGGNKDGDD